MSFNNIKRCIIVNKSEITIVKILDISITSVFSGLNTITYKPFICPYFQFFKIII